MQTQHRDIANVHTYVHDACMGQLLSRDVIAFGASIEVQAEIISRPFSECYSIFPPESISKTEHNPKISPYISVEA